MAEARHGGAEIIVVADEAALVGEAGRRIIGALGAALKARGQAHIALSGGSIAGPLYRELASPSLRAELDWSRVHLWWADERFVPTDHAESNAGAAYANLLGMPVPDGGDPAGLPIDPQNVHPVEVEETLSESDPVELAAQMYANELHKHVPLAREGLPRLDLILSGVGPDGHIMSVFPGSAALAEDAAVAVAVSAPEHVEPHLARVTLSARLLPLAGLVMIMVVGTDKREIMGRVLGPEHDPARWPAQAALLPNAVWLLDRDAAGEVR